MMIYFYQIFNFYLIMYFPKIMQTFYDLYLLEATPNGCIRIFFTTNLFSLINSRAVLSYHNTPHCSIEG